MRGAAAWGLVVLALAACGGDSGTETSAPATGAPTSTSTTAAPPASTGDVIGPDGGVAQSDDGGFTVTFPAGALAAATPISIIPADDGSAPMAPIRGVHDVDAGGATLGTAATVTQTLDAAALGVGEGEVPLLTFLHERDGVWGTVHTTTTRAGDLITATAEVDRFSLFAVVATGDLYDYSARFVMAPGEFTREVGDLEAIEITSVEGAPADFEWSGDPGLDVVELSERDATVTCLEVGTHTYLATLYLTREIQDEDNPFNIERWTEEIATGVGEATCLGSSGPDPNAFVGTWNGNLSFVPVEGGPPGSQYTADFVIVITLDAPNFLVATTQLPSNQMQMGMGILDGDQLFFTVGGSGPGYSEALVGVVVLEDGNLLLDGFSVGLAPDGSQEGLLDGSRFELDDEDSDVDDLIIRILEERLGDPQTHPWLHRVQGELEPE